MIVVDEYIAVRVLRGRRPAELPDDEDLALPASAHWRLLQAVHGDRGGRLSQLFAGASPAVVNAIRWPRPEVLQVLDPRPLLDRAAMLANRYGGGLLTGETLAAGLVNGRQCASAISSGLRAPCSRSLPSSGSALASRFRRNFSRSASCQ